MTNIALSTLTNSAVQLVPYACAQPYQPGSGCNGQLFRPFWAHQRGTAVRSMYQRPFITEASAKHKIIWAQINFLIPSPYACRGRTVQRFPTIGYHLSTVKLEHKGVLWTRLGRKGFLISGFSSLCTKCLVRFIEVCLVRLIELFCCNQLFKVNL